MLRTRSEGKNGERRVRVQVVEYMQKTGVKCKHNGRQKLSHLVEHKQKSRLHNPLDLRATANHPSSHHPPQTD